MFVCISASSVPKSTADHKSEGQVQSGCERSCNNGSHVGEGGSHLHSVNTRLLITAVRH